MEGTQITERNGLRVAANVLNVNTLEQIRRGCSHCGPGGVQRLSHYTAREIWKAGMGWEGSFGTSLAA